MPPKVDRPGPGISVNVATSAAIAPRSESTMTDALRRSDVKESRSSASTRVPDTMSSGRIAW
jgi:hypothetical protein